MIVVVIIGVLSVTVFHYYNENINQTKLIRMKSDMDELKKNIKLFAINSQGIYPVALDQLKGTYFKEIPRSPYGTPYTLDTEKGEIVCIYYENNSKKIHRVRFKPE